MINQMTLNTRPIETRKSNLRFSCWSNDTGTSALKTKAAELWDAIVLLETEKYDLEERSKRQDYDVSPFSYINLSAISPVKPISSLYFIL